CYLLFFFQAEDGIRDFHVTGVQTCALPILDQGRTGDVEMSTVVLAGTGTNGQVYRSTDGGQSWSPVQQLGSEQYVWSLAYLGDGVVLAGTGPTGQVYRSTDGGQSWSLVQRLGSATHVYVLLNLGGGVVLAGAGSKGQVSRSQD